MKILFDWPVGWKSGSENKAGHHFWKDSFLRQFCMRSAKMKCHSQTSKEHINEIFQSNTFYFWRTGCRYLLGFLNSGFLLKECIKSQSMIKVLRHLITKVDQKFGMQLSLHFILAAEILFLHLRDSWGSSENKLELKIERPLVNIACLNRWNTLYLFPSFSRSINLFFFQFIQSTHVKLLARGPHVAPLLVWCGPQLYYLTVK